MNLDGPVRVAGTAGSGTATITLSFDNWKGAKVASTTHAVVVAPAKPGPKPEPAAENLIATLIHPDRQASIQSLQFSEDGKRLFTAGYPSGILQVWDWAAKKELRRIDTPSGSRSTYNYAVLSHDWKTLYVPIESKKVTSSEKDGKVIQRLEYSGRIGVWDIATGQERAPIRLPPGHAPFYAVLSPDGRHLLTSERQSFSVGETRRGGVWSWDLQTGARRKVWDGMDYPRFTPDGKTVSFTVDDWEARIYTLKLLDFATGKELASFPCPDKDVIMLGGEFSPDGSILMATMSPLKGGCATILFLEGKTLAERGRFACPRAPDGSCAVSSKFMPDGKSCLILDAAGTAHIWDLASQKEARSIEVGAPSGTMTFSRDGKTLAVAWAPERPAELKGVRNVDPRDLAQPRVTIVDLEGNKPPRTLIAPHGYQGGIAFSPNGKILAFGTSGGVRLFDLTR